MAVIRPVKNHEFDQQMSEQHNHGFKHEETEQHDLQEAKQRIVPESQDPKFLHSNPIIVKPDVADLERFIWFCTIFNLMQQIDMNVPYVVNMISSS